MELELQGECSLLDQEFPPFTPTHPRVVSGATYIRERCGISDITPSELSAYANRLRNLLIRDLLKTTFNKAREEVLAGIDFNVRTKSGLKRRKAVSEALGKVMKPFRKAFDEAQEARKRSVPFTERDATPLYGAQW